jgi:hypothetical protein
MRVDKSRMKIRVARVLTLINSCAPLSALINFELVHILMKVDESFFLFNCNHVPILARGIHASYWQMTSSLGYIRSHHI